MAHITSMAQRAFSLLKLISHSPRHVAKRAEGPIVMGFKPGTLERIRNEEPQRQSPSKMRLYSLGECMGKYRLDGGNTERSASSPPRVQGTLPSSPPARTCPAPVKVQLPVHASWLHDHWKPGQVRAGVTFFEGLASAPTGATSTRPSSPVATRGVAPPPAGQAPVQRKVKRRAPPPPVSQAPLIAPSLVKSLATTARSIRHEPLAHASVPKPPAPPALPAPPKTETRADAPGASATPELLRAHSAPGRSALFAELLNNPMVARLRRQESSPAALATEATRMENETGAQSKAGNKERRSSPVYLKGADIYPFHDQLQKTLGKRTEAKAHVPSPEALRQAEVLREKRAQGLQSHGFSGPWKPSEADHSLQQQLKMVLGRMGQASA